jgi:salicylate hydroxylase
MQKVFHSPELSRIETARPYIEKQWAPQTVRQRYDWLLTYDPTTVPLNP